MFFKSQRKVLGVSYPVSWASCRETWLKFDFRFLRLQRKKMKSGIFILLGSYPLVGRHVVNESKVGCYVVNELEIF
jgi:hypothetical protein